MGAQQQWRHYGYSKAAKTLRGLTWEVTDVSQANLTLSKSHSPKYFANLSSPFCVNVCVTRVCHTCGHARIVSSPFSLPNLTPLEI